jgi:hypothetical protein
MYHRFQLFLLKVRPFDFFLCWVGFAIMMTIMALNCMLFILVLEASLFYRTEF